MKALKPRLVFLRNLKHLAIPPERSSPPPSLVDERYAAAERYNVKTIERLRGERDRLEQRLCDVDDDLIHLVQMRIRENKLQIEAAEKSRNNIDASAQYDQDLARWNRALETFESLPAMQHKPSKLKTALGEFDLRLNLKMSKADDGTYGILGALSAFW